MHREHLVERAESAYGAYERGRFQDAFRAIKPVADEAPGVAAVRELAGLAAYRSARWRDATRHLSAYGALSDSTEHLPVLMDCQRALHKPKKVAELWSELRHSSPDPDVLAEGRIVAAASLADTGDLNGAIAMLATAGASKALRNPSDRHLRQWYLLADLYERAGDVPRAREYFERVLRADPEAYDVAERLRGLGPRAPVPTEALEEDACEGEGKQAADQGTDTPPPPHRSLQPGRLRPGQRPGLTPWSRWWPLPAPAPEPWSWWSSAWASAPGPQARWWSSTAEPLPWSWWSSGAAPCRSWVLRPSPACRSG